MRRELGAFYVLLSVLVLMPLHLCLCTLISAKDVVSAKSSRLAHACEGINKCLARYVKIMFTHPRDAPEFGAIHRLADLDDQRHLAAIRKEMLRCYSGVRKRLASPLTVNPMRAMYSVDLAVAGENIAEHLDNIRDAFDDLNDAQPCCKGIAGQRLSQWIGDNLHVEVLINRCKALHRAVRLWRSNIIHTERRHSGNRRRGRARQGKPRSLRRQVAQYIVSASKAIFSQLGGRDLRKNLSGMKFEDFKRRATKKTKRQGIGGSNMRMYINQKSKAVKGQGYTRSDFKTMRRSWADEHPDLDAEAKGQLSSDLRDHQKDTRATVALVGSIAGVPGAAPVQHRTHHSMGDKLWPLRAEVYTAQREAISNC